ncbi:MAG: NAD-dependent epimerase/dehydratase family protein [Candidatus Saccharicenans sp.]|jgi:nucleoside-diphosphate-sugar epimerase
MHESKKILITGGSGFLGTHLIGFLAQGGYRIRATFNAKMPSISTIDQTEWVKVDDISSPESWNALIKGVDCVIHLIGLAHVFKENSPADFSKFKEVNVLPTQALAESCVRSGKVKKFIFISSVGAVCSSSTIPINELSPCHPETGYGISKLEAENVLKDTLQDKVSWCILRPTMIYGPGDPGNMARLIKLVKMGIPLPLGSVHNARSFLYIGNFLEIMAKVLSHRNAEFKTYLIADDETISTPEIIRIMAEILNKKVLVIPFPVGILRLMGKVGSLLERNLNISIGINTYSVDRLTESLVVDNSFIKHDLDFEMPYSFYEGIRQTLN